MHRFYDSLLNNLMLSNKNSLLEADLKKKEIHNWFVWGFFPALVFFTVFRRYKQVI